MARFTALLVGLSLVACAADSTDGDSTSSGEDELRRGAVDWGTPQVGRMRKYNSPTSVGVCTATLVGPRTVLAASHCFGYATAEPGKGGNYGDFTIHKADGTPWVTKKIDGYISYGKEAGASDVLLAHLVEPITVVKPIPIASGDPWWGTSVTIWGYGIYDCSQTGTEGKMDGNKRSFTFTWGTQSHSTCGGDSGGPTIANGAVFQVTSAKQNFWDVWELQISGKIPPLYSKLSTQIAAWQ